MQLSSEQTKVVERLKSIDSTNEIYWDEETHTPKFAKGVLSTASQDDPETIARSFLRDSQGLMDFQEGLEERLQVSHIEKDKEGFRHVFLQQYVQGLPLFEGSTQVHINPQGQVVAYKDYRLAKLGISLDPAVDRDSALTTAMENLGKDPAKVDPQCRLALYRDTDKTVHLVWEVDLLVPEELGAYHYLVDAQTNQLLYKYTQIRQALARNTHTANHARVLPGVLVLKDNQTTDDRVAQAAHGNAATVYDYFNETFGRDSYDDQGSPLVSTVHFGHNYNNAFWTDAFKQMVYGDGDGVRWEPLSLALDIVGHELTHAVTSNTARFVYAEQSGALDESFADVFGVFITNDGPITDWQMGEGVFTPFRDGDALRDLADPPKFGQPDHMNDFLRLSPGELPDPDKNDNGYVHSNSGIPNKVAYLLVVGGTHHDVTVQGLGREKAEQIYYIALTQYLSSATRSRWTFKQARFALLNACRQLYGDSGAEYAAVKNAWAAVGLGEPAGDLTTVQRTVTPNMAIPDNTSTGIRSRMQLDNPGQIKDIAVTVDIRHTYIGDLRVTLEAPSGTRVVLHDRAGRSTHDIEKTWDRSSLPALQSFVGEPVQGGWSLRVSDHAPVDQGILEQWGMNLLLEPTLPQRFTRRVTPAKDIPDQTRDGIESALEVDVDGQVIGLSVTVDITHTWIGDLKVALETPAGDSVLLHNRTGNSRHNIQRTYSTGTNTALATLIGTATRGTWKLKVADLATEDIGRLNSWDLDITWQA